MSRSGYDDGCDGWRLICWRGAVASALCGARGQSFLQEMLIALDALPKKELTKNELEIDGAVCALGAVGKMRGLDMGALDPYDRKAIARAFGIAPAMAAEIAWVNDDCGWRDTPEARFARVRAWIEKQITDRADVPPPA